MMAPRAGMHYYCLVASLGFLVAGRLLVAALFLLSADTAPNDPIYIRPNAMASYLSLAGFEGVHTSGRFVTAAIKLARSWRKRVPMGAQLQYDMVLLVADPYGVLMRAQALRDSGWKLVYVEPLYGRPSAEGYVFQNRYTHTAQFSKLHLWSLTGYRHIVYLDSDMLLVGDATRAITPFLGEMRPDRVGMTEDTGGRSRYNAAMMLLMPSMHTYERMRAEVMRLGYDVEVQEQGFLNAFFGNRTDGVVVLPKRLDEGVNNLTEACLVMHFIGELKAWSVCEGESKRAFARACAAWDAYPG